MKLLKLTALSAALLSTSVMAEWSANVGMVSDYHFRGIQQTQSASASAGVDYEKGGFYAGSWAAEVEDGLEVDFYDEMHSKPSCLKKIGNYLIDN